MIWRELRLLTSLLSLLEENLHDLCRIEGVNCRDIKASCFGKFVRFDPPASGLTALILLFLVGLVQVTFEDG